MSEYIIEVEYDTFNSTFTQMRHEEIVRCRDCANAAECEDGTLDCHGTLVQTWDYYNDEPLRNPVPPNGFCAWGVRRAES